MAEVLQDARSHLHFETSDSQSTMIVQLSTHLLWDFTRIFTPVSRTLFQPTYHPTHSGRLPLEEAWEEISFPDYDAAAEPCPSLRNEEGEFPLDPVTPTVVKKSLAAGHKKTLLGSSIVSLAVKGVSKSLGSAKDDSTIQLQPARCVDYLSHDWEEQEVQSSWKHVMRERKIHSDGTRLENAIWRIWTKTKYGLETVPPEELNW